MKKIKQLLVSISFLFLLNSCANQDNKNIKIDVLNVKEIKIVNKVYCSYHNLKGKNRVITSREEIEKIIKGFSYSKPIETDVNMKVNNGFFDIIFYEEDKKHIFTLIYTVYNGVVLWYEGDLYRNDRLEVVIYKFFEE